MVYSRELNRSLDLTTPSGVKAFFEEHGLKPRKLLGQHFLVDKNILNKIIETAEIEKGERILEIGAGIGTLTLALAKKASYVVAIEKDRNLASLLKELASSYPNIKVINGDILNLELKEILDEFPIWKVVSNPPYNITAPLLFKLISLKEKFSFIILMFQRELADRIIAKPTTKNYSFLTVKVQYHMEVETIHKVSKRVFFPTPQVDSTILKLKPLKNPSIRVKDENFFFEVVDAIFKSRRKTFKNSLKVFNPPEEFWNKCPFDPMRRGETFSLNEIGILSDILKNSWKKKSGK